MQPSRNSSHPHRFNLNPRSLVVMANKVKNAKRADSQLPIKFYKVLLGKV